jgi:hypothetical protein
MKLMSGVTCAVRVRFFLIPNSLSQVGLLELFISRRDSAMARKFFFAGSRVPPSEDRGRNNKKYKPKVYRATRNEFLTHLQKSVN